MNKLFVLLLFISPIAWGRGDPYPPEPGTTRGCVWPARIGIPAPDLVGDSIDEARKKQNGFTIRVVGEKPSPYLTKNRIIGQDPGICARWKSASREVQVVLSAGKTRVESAFVKDQEGRLLPYSLAKFGTPEISKDSCVTNKNKRPIYDIGSPVIGSLFHPSACSPQGIAESPRRNLRIEAELKRLKKRVFEITFRFFARQGTVTATFAKYINTYFKAVNPGFHLHSFPTQYGGPRFSRSVSESQPFEVKGFLNIDENIPFGDHWLTFAFRNLTGETFNESSEPVKLTISP